MSAPESKYRPAAEHRWVDGDDIRTDPVRIGVRTEFLYSTRTDGIALPPGRTRHAFAQSGRVTSSDVPAPYDSLHDDIRGHLYRAIAAFGDDKDLIIEVRLRGADDEI